MADVEHSNLTGATAIHPAAYIQSSDPGAVGANKLWIDTTTTASVWKRRNSINTAWTVVGSALTALGAIEYGGTSGARTQLTIGAEGSQLVVDGGIPSWGSGIAPNLFLAANYT